MDDLNYLKEFLSINYNLEVNITESDKIFYIKNINIIIFIFIFLITILLILLFFFKFDIKSITIIIILLYFIQKYFFMLYLYYKNKNKYEDNSISYNIDNLNLDTGDILQESTNWDNKNGFLTYLSGINFLHNILIIKFNNTLYGLHFLDTNFGFPKNILKFESKYIEIFPLKNYLIDNYYSVKYYRLFKLKEPISNDLIFNFLKNLDMKKLTYSFVPNMNVIDILKNNNKFHCLSFILNLLNYCNIIPKLNFQNFISDDLTFLPEFSNSKYNNSLIIKIICD